MRGKELASRKECSSDGRFRSMSLKRCAWSCPPPSSLPSSQEHVFVHWASTVARCATSSRRCTRGGRLQLVNASESPDHHRLRLDSGPDDGIKVEVHLAEHHYPVLIEVRYIYPCTESESNLDDGPGQVAVANSLRGPQRFILPVVQHDHRECGTSMTGCAIKDVRAAIAAQSTTQPHFEFCHALLHSHLRHCSLPRRKRVCRPVDPASHRAACWRGLDCWPNLQYHLV